MGPGARMFWQLNYASTSQIDTILGREEGFTLEQLLDEDEVLQECKAQNAKLLEFMTQACARAARRTPFANSGAPT